MKDFIKFFKHEKVQNTTKKFKFESEKILQTEHM